MSSAASPLQAASPTPADAAALALALSSSTGSVASTGSDGADAFAAPSDDVHPVFEKTLYSDLDPARSLALFKRAWQLDPLLSEVMGPVDGSSGASVLSACMSVLVFHAGERIISAGEDATFAALVLEGDVTAVAPGVVVNLPTGSWVGEMALFERGTRSADIHAREQGAVLAVLSYEDLERLNSAVSVGAAGAAAHELCYKLTMMLATTSLKKLRKMTEKPTANSSATTGAAVSPAPSIPSTPQKGSINATTTAGTAKPAAPAKESLFVSRLAKQAQHSSAQSQELEARTRAELAQMKSLVVRREAEAQYAKDNVKNRMSKLEKELADSQAKTATLTKLLANEKKKRVEAEGMLAHLREEHTLALAEATSSRVMGQEEWEAKSHDLAMQLLHSEQARSKRELEYSPLIESLRAQIREAQGLIEAQTVQMSQKDAALATSAASIDSLHAKQGSLETEISALCHRLSTLDTEKGHLVYRLNDFASRNESLDVDVHSWRRKAADYLDNYEKLLIKYRKDISDLTKEKSIALSSHRTMHKLVRSLSLKLYVRNWRLRRWIFNLHLMVSSMVVKRWEDAMGDEQREAQSFWKTNGGAVAGSKGTPAAGPADVGASLYQQLQQSAARSKRMLAMLAATAPVSPAGAVAANGAPNAASVDLLSPTSSMSVLSPSMLIGQPAQPPPLAAPFPLSAVAAPAATASAMTQLSTLAYTAPGETQHISYSALRAEKKRYLQSLRSRRTPPPPLLFLLQSLQDELIELRTPVDELSSTLRALRTTLDSFFQRNIQLTAGLSNTRKALEVAMANYEQLKAAMSRRAHAETSVNPFSHNALLLDSRPNTSGGAASAAAAASGAQPGHRGRQHSFGSSAAFNGEEEKDMLGSTSGSAHGGVPTIAAAITAAAAAAASASPSHSTPASARRPGSSGGVVSSAASPSSGAIDWAALDVEKSSGYGVTRPMVRRESRIAPGLGHKASTTTGGARRPSMMHATTPHRTPHPPSSSPTTPHAHTAGSAFLPRITTPAQ